MQQEMPAQIDICVYFLEHLCAWIRGFETDYGERILGGEKARNEIDALSRAVPDRIKSRQNSPGREDIIGDGRAVSVEWTKFLVGGKARAKIGMILPDLGFQKMRQPGMDGVGDGRAVHP